MILRIDTTQRESLEVALLQSGSTVAHVRRGTVGGGQSQELLPAVSELLKQAGKTMPDVAEIEVAVGPGSFTGVRVGVSVANALALALAIPVNGLAVGQFAVPVYGAEPNIMVKKSKGKIQKSKL
jgi:tRNA threonylcarbamoyladenosine biosynthesis protein TsaB